MWKSALLKNQKIHGKTLSVIFLGTIQKKRKQISSQHNSMTELCRTLFKYEKKMDMARYNWLKTS